MTPAQYNALSRQKDEEDMQADYRSGIIASIVHNLFAKKGREKSALDFFPRWKAKAGRKQGQSAEETALRFRLLEAHQKRLARSKGAK